MKKLFAWMLAIVMVASLTACGTDAGETTAASEAVSTEAKTTGETAADETTAAETTAVETAETWADALATEDVTFTLAAGGFLMVEAQKLSVTDADGDGVFTLDEVLTSAHDAFYEGGAAAGYKSEESEYGRSVVMLWGEENGGAFSFCCDNNPCMSITEEIPAGSSVYAYSFSDLTAFSDEYSFFTLVSQSDSEITLQLSAITYDENFNPVTTPVSGASIIINYEDSGIVTDADGNATIPVTEDMTSFGGAIVSATSDTVTLVPPIYVING